MIFNPNEVFTNPIQIGLIARDLEKTLENFNKILGMENFRIADFPPPGQTPVRMYHGKNGDFTAKFCFYNWGNIEFEIIQPLEGENIWADFLNVKGDLGLHHIKFKVERHAPVHEYFASMGIEISQRGEGVGTNAGKEWVFYNTVDTLGFDIETLNEIIEDK